MKDMKPLFHCEIEYVPCPHLMQIYTGFIELQKKGIIELVLKQKPEADPSKGVITAIINKKYRVVYDALDGFNWIQADILDNLNYFQNNFKVDYYFKRSYCQLLLSYLPTGCKLFPLGLNYNIQPKGNMIYFYSGIVGKIKYAVKRSKYLNKAFNTGFLFSKDFEHYPVPGKEDKILFITRLWDPEEVELEHSRVEREQLNQMRVACIKACKKEFGQRFTGGLVMNDFTKEHYSSLLMPDELTNKFKYVESVKKHSICVATTGLHNSIGWKFGEYVAASRAIVSEPLQFEVPGPFAEGKNYFEFWNSDQLLEKIDLLLRNRDLLFQTMQNNFHYYNTHLKPDILILNTLFTIVQDNTTKNVNNNYAKAVLV